MAKSLGSIVAGSFLIFALPASALEHFPEVIRLPVGWGPEGIASGRGTEFFAGARQMSPVAGAVYRCGLSAVERLAS